MPPKRKSPTNDDAESPQRRRFTRSARTHVQQPVAASDVAPTGTLGRQVSREATPSSPTATAIATLDKLPAEALEKHFPPLRSRILDILSGAFASSLRSESRHGARKGKHADQTAGGADEELGLVGMDAPLSQLLGVLEGTVKRGEGNSALVMGPKGAGKTSLLRAALHKLRQQSSQSGHSPTPAARARSSANGKIPPTPSASPPSSTFHHIYLDGALQTTDRLALREMARQLLRSGAFAGLEGEGDAALGIDGVMRGEGERGEGVGEEDEEDDLVLEVERSIFSSLSETTTQILSLLSSLSAPTTSTDDKPIGRRPLPLIITLENFDLFADHPRQALLYCLLDAVQAGTYSGGLAVIGTTCRLDAPDQLEKRVKSRFSHRVIHVYPPASLDALTEIARKALLGGSGGGAAVGEARPGADDDDDDDDDDEDGDGDGLLVRRAWAMEVDNFCKQPDFLSVVSGVFDLNNDVGLLYRILILSVAPLSPCRPNLNASVLKEAVELQRGDYMAEIVQDLPEPSLHMLISAKHLLSRDRELFNFEMVYDEYRRFADRSWASGIASATAGKMRVKGMGKEGALVAFEHLQSIELFLSDSTSARAAPITGGGTTTSSSSSVRNQFARVRCVLTAGEIVQGVKARAASLPTEVVKWATGWGGG